MTSQPRLLFVDAYDSFSDNIAALLRQHINAIVTKITIDADLKGESLRSFVRSHDAIVLGPGPGNPNNSKDIGLFSQVWDLCAQDQIPVLGICLGFQSLCITFGLSVSQLGIPCHGHAKLIRHTNNDIFEDVGQVVATNYNSLGVRLTAENATPEISRPASRASGHSNASKGSIVSHHQAIQRGGDEPLESLDQPSAQLMVLAIDNEGYVMAVRHRSLPFWGLQFHPESCKSNAACSEVVRLWWQKAHAHNMESHPTTSWTEPARTYSLRRSTQSTSSATFSRVTKSLRSLMAPVDMTTLSITLSMGIGRQQLADLCNRTSDRHPVTMLESTRRGRFSIYAFPDESTWQLEYENGALLISRRQEVMARNAMSLPEAMKLIEDFLAAHLVSNGPIDIPFWGGLVGFFSYEAGLDLLNVAVTDDRQARPVPEISLMWVNRSIVVDHQKKSIVVQSIRHNDQPWIQEMTRKLRTESQSSSSTPQTTDSTTTSPPLANLPSHATYLSQIRSCQSSLHAGDSYELCLTTSAPITTPSDPYALYTHLQKTNPAPYSAYLHLNRTTVLSSSPEQFLSWSRSTPHLDMMPMKGTLPKSPSIPDAATAKTILLNPKEEAENLMIADLIRHDLHSALGPEGKVDVMKLFEVVETESLYQLISHIRGYIPLTHPAECDAREKQRQILRRGHAALRHALPAGSMTGAPKKRSCEILRNLERRNRGVYSGVIGYFDVGGGGAWSVAIRCAFSHDSEDVVEEQGENKEVDDLRTNDSGRQGEVEGNGEKVRKRKWHIGAGGAITVLSEEEAEWEEMRAKMGSVLRGFGVNE